MEVSMQCPLCAGPLRIRDVERYACERGHEISADDLRVTTQARVTVAFWMAIEALETEAEALRVLDSASHPDGTADLAEQAAKDAELLRQLATAHLPDRYADARGA
jgi:hypothetical protein